MENSESQKQKKRLIKFPRPRKEHFIIFVKFVIVPLIILLIAGRIFVIKTYERELYYSNEAYIQREEIKVGSEGFGNVSSISVNVGDYVHKGDILYKYINSDLDDKIFDLQRKGEDLLSPNPAPLDPTSPEANITINNFNKNIEFVVRAKVDGIIKEININVGDYVTKDNVAMVMQDSSVFVASYIKVPINLIGKIVPGIQAYIKLNPNLTLSGFVKDVAPTYDADKNLMKIEVLISAKELSKIDLKTIASGTPVDVTVTAPDSFTEALKSIVNNIHVNLIKRYFIYEV